VVNHYPLEYTYEAVNGKSVVDLIFCGSKIKSKYFSVDNTQKGDIENFYATILSTLHNSVKQIRLFLRETSQPWFDSECFLFKQDLLFLRRLSLDLHFQNLPDTEEREISNIYGAAKKYYRTLCTSKKRLAQESKDNLLIREAESKCYISFSRLTPKLATSPTISPCQTMGTKF
jgi:hypothetical protein